MVYATRGQKASERVLHEIEVELQVGNSQPVMHSKLKQFGLYTFFGGRRVDWFGFGFWCEKTAENLL
jgi:hypothetical protein